MKRIEEAINKNSTCVFECKAHSPYAGCFYENNYWLLKDNLVYPLYVSGVACELLDLPKITDGVGPHKFLVTMIKNPSRYSDWDAVPINELEVGSNLLNSITKLMLKHELKPPTWCCSICLEDCVGYAHFLGYTGDGGVGIILTDECCDDCFKKIRWCGNCGYYGAPVIPEMCPKCEEFDYLCDPDDYAETFGLAGEALDSDGDSQGIKGVSVVIISKGGS